VLAALQNRDRDNDASGIESLDCPDFSDLQIDLAAQRLSQGLHHGLGARSQLVLDAFLPTANFGRIDTTPCAFQTHPGPHLPIIFGPHAGSGQSNQPSAGVRLLGATRFGDKISYRYGLLNPGRNRLLAGVPKVLGDGCVGAIERLENRHQNLGELPALAFLAITPTAGNQFKDSRSRWRMKARVFVGKGPGVLGIRLLWRHGCQIWQMGCLTLRTSAQVR
jgi:hypothetical protein